jgi:hypothetical protein
VIAYYETESQQPPGALLADLATALKVSADELLGLRAIAEKRSPNRARLLKRLPRPKSSRPATTAPSSRSSTAPRSPPPQRDTVTHLLDGFRGASVRTRE